MSDEVLAELSASPARRWLGVGMLVALGVLLIYTALVRPPAVMGWQVFLLAIGGISLWGAERMYRATCESVELTRAGLRVSDGEIIAPLSHIASVDRGMFVFKPSNGFILRLNTGASRRWAPGLWWRFGRRVGIGGVTPGAQAKMMADILAVLLKQRDEGPE